MLAHSAQRRKAGNCIVPSHIAKRRRAKKGVSDETSITCAAESTSDSPGREAAPQQVHPSLTFHTPALQSSVPASAQLSRQHPLFNSTALEKAAPCAGFGLTQIHLVFRQSIRLWLTLNVGQAQPIGSVALAVRVGVREGVKEDVAEVRVAAIADDLQRSVVWLGADMAAPCIL
mmetsp:Transcript_2788/g.6540  ORF Transcript_2788/g.6540 Transcript_2788/m.6540 type:complete len:174 (+) Transcript_2788:77-598(+)